MNFRTIIAKVILVTAIALAACQSAPKTNLERVDALKKQVKTNVQTLETLETKDLVHLQKDFMVCDSILQFMPSEKVDETFQQLLLVDAYIKQFKETCPVMRADMDSTLIQLDNLKSDIETHYLSDSLATVYLDMETQHVTLLNNQVEYFKDRLGSCNNTMKDFKKKK